MESRLEKRRPFYIGQLDFPFLIAVIALCAFGLVMLFSALVQKKLNRATLRRYRGAILTICVALILSGVILQKSPVLQKQVERQQSIAERVKKEGTMKIEEEDEY